MNTVAGLDPSLSSTGFAVIAVDDSLTLGRIRPGDCRGAARLEVIRSEVDSICATAGLVVIEGLAFGRSQRGTQDRSGLHWLIRWQLHRRRIPVAVVAPSSLKVYATGSGRATKEEVLTETKDRYSSFSSTPGNHDEADALILAAMGMDYIGFPLVSLPNTHRRALDMVRWPSPEKVRVP